MNTQKQKLLVEDEENFCSLLQNYLKLSKYDVDWAKDGAQGYSAFSKKNFDLCIFDVMMPNMYGFTLTEKIRSKNKTTPILFLTARNMKEDMIKGYKLGADDYLNKPFDIEILLLKLEAIFQRNAGSKIELSKDVAIGAYLYRPVSRVLTHPAIERKLSPKEGALLQMLCEHLNQIMPREKALKEIWDEDSYFTTRSMDVYITKLRKYLAEDSSVRIENLHSSGYMLITK